MFVRISLIFARSDHHSLTSHSSCRATGAALTSRTPGASGQTVGASSDALARDLLRTGGVGDTAGAKGYTRMLFKAFRGDAPVMIGIWLLVDASALVYGLVSGKDLRDALSLGAAVLPLALPLAPLTFLRWDIRARTLEALPALGLACLWFVLTMPIAIVLGLLLSGVVGAE